MGSSPFQREVEWFVRTLLITGAWLDEVVTGLSAELPAESHREGWPCPVVLEMLCETIGTAMQRTDPRGLRRATELIDLVSSATEEHLRHLCDLSPRMPDGGSDGRTYE